MRGSRIDAVTQFRWQIVVDDKLGANDAVGLGISAAFEASWLPEQAHLFFEAANDRIEIGLFIRERLLFRDPQPFVWPASIDQGRNQG